MKMYVISNLLELAGVLTCYSYQHNLFYTKKFITYVAIYILGGTKAIKNQ